MTIAYHIDPKSRYGPSQNRTIYSRLGIYSMKFITERPFADPDAAARMLVELANAFEPAQDGRVYIDRRGSDLLHRNYWLRTPRRLQ